ncbi:alkaline phosphatase family protein [Natranaeroarchaeum sulfidigenes]|uniref:Phosphodiesterase of AP superfamily n=1 Tax=Natranaeroarchaeum sulfidigenes TaxID=2784880 RepID=A0A897MR33_9EURY|nr:alkaline phosphatase family protein [Natranaeroarchaeum sulfidigenes]QSG03024.1 Phosphodiesterase of AP superfamily [Natranaeroarchaeum sulfidigenes]
MQTTKAFVLGLDGVPWNLVERWAKDGELEHFSTLFEEGASGPLESTIPPQTALAWPSIATGVRADTHGIYDFQNLHDNYTHRMATSADRGGTALWDYLSPAVVGNVPMTYPASAIDGQMVTGMMTPEQNEGFTHPPELRDEIERKIPEYEIGLKWTEYADEPAALVEDLQSNVESRRELMRLLMDTDDWQLFFFVYTAPDRLQHLNWDEDVILEHYRYLDEILGEVIEYTRAQNANLFVVSDHGFGPISRVAYPNRLLEREGFLARTNDDNGRGVLEKLGITKASLERVLDGVGVDEAKLVDALPNRITDTVARQVPGDHPLYDVDFDATTAFFHGTSHLYVNRKGRFDRGTVRSDEVETVKRELRETFESATDPETGERLFDLVDGDSLFPRDDRSPDFIVQGREGYLVQSALSDTFVTDTGAMEATHDHEGIIFALGPSIAANTRTEDATVYDVAPTLLHSIGEPIPEEIDGTVLEEILTIDGSPEHRELNPSMERSDAETDDDFQDVEDRLRGLGYME